jgi:hypothetical protein
VAGRIQNINIQIAPRQRTPNPSHFVDEFGLVVFHGPADRENVCDGHPGRANAAASG